jgi:hypothetical protein
MSTADAVDRSHLTQEGIVGRLVKVFEWIEQRGMRVGDVWLHPKQAQELFVRHPDVFDREVEPKILRYYAELKGATLLGYIFGARVFESEIVVENHVGIIPDGWDAKLVDSAGCTPF